MNQQAFGKMRRKEAKRAPSFSSMRCTSTRCTHRVPLGGACSSSSANRSCIAAIASGVMALHRDKKAAHCRHHKRCTEHQTHAAPRPP